MREVTLFEVDRGCCWSEPKLTIAIGKVTTDWCLAWWRNRMKVVEAWWPTDRETGYDDDFGFFQNKAKSIRGGVHWS